MTKRNIVVTPALPYANAPLHIGHLLEHTQAHIWYNFQKRRGHNCKFICGSDSHGTPIMLAARKKNISEEEFIKKVREGHIQDLNNFGIYFDNFSSTHTETHKKYMYEFYEKIKEAGAVESRVIDQLYSEKEGMFLPDRYIKGTCPKCKAEDQNGDNCDNCGATYSPMDMINPRSAESGETLVVRQSEHIFFKLNQYKDFLSEWLPHHVGKETYNKVKEWFSEDLRDWDISRDNPYFGFEVPDKPGKYFYVWADAPIGYISATAEHCQSSGEDVNDFWRNPKAEIYHFIGKDIVNFHTLFWPAFLKSAGYNLPNRVFVHGFLNTNNAKMSKSKGTSLNVKSYIKHLDPSYIRYYFATKLSSKPNDIEFNFDDFTQRVNSDLVGKLINLGSRGAQMLHKNFAGQCSQVDSEAAPLIKEAIAASEKVAELYEACEYSKVTTIVRELTDKANQYFDSLEPWKLVKTEPKRVQEVLTTILTLFRIYVIYLSPILPKLSQDTAELFQEDDYQWSDFDKTLSGKTLKPYKHLMKRIDKKQVEAIQQENQTQTSHKKNETKKSKNSKSSEPPSEITIDDFLKIDLRVAEIIEAKEVEGADKLLQLTLNVGEENTKNVFAGIKSAFSPEDLQGKLVAMVYNLKPRKMKFGWSEGMVLAAGPGGKDLFILSPSEGAKPGQKIK